MHYFYALPCNNCIASAPHYADIRIDKIKQGMINYIHLWICEAAYT